MTEVIVDAGICDYKSRIKAELIGGLAGGKIKISVDSECGKVEELREELKDVEISSCLAKFGENIVYQKASEILPHVTCPVPCAITKAVEVEADAAVKKDVTITFVE